MFEIVICIEERKDSSKLRKRQSKIIIPAFDFVFMSKNQFKIIFLLVILTRYI